MKPLISARYERRLQKEIEILNAKIRDLTAERQALERQLIKARRESVGGDDVSRKNSFNRVMIERRIIDALSFGVSLSNKELFEISKMVSFELNPNTFRTHLHRLKLKGAIETDGKQGKWRLAQPKRANPSSVGEISH